MGWALYQILHAVSICYLLHCQSACDAQSIICYHFTNWQLSSLEDRESVEVPMKVIVLQV